MYIDTVRHLTLLLGQCREDRTEMVDRIDLVGLDGPVDLRTVRYVKGCARAGLSDVDGQGCTVPGGNDVVVAIPLS